MTGISSAIGLTAGPTQVADGDNAAQMLKVNADGSITISGSYIAAIAAESGTTGVLDQIAGLMYLNAKLLDQISDQLSQAFGAVPANPVIVPQWLGTDI